MTQTVVHEMTLTNPSERKPELSDPAYKQELGHHGMTLVNWNTAYEINNVTPASQAASAPRESFPDAIETFSRYPDLANGID